MIRKRKKFDVAAGDSRDERVGAIVNTLLDRQARGHAIGESDIVNEAGELADEVREHLALIQQLKPVVNSIETLLRQGVLQPSDEPAYPAVLGPYRILESLGRGGMGIVLRAEEPALSRIVALKLLRPELADDPTLLKRFVREAKAAAALQHPNIVTVYAVGCEQSAHFISMEFVAGENLATAIRRCGALDTETTRHIFRQLLDALRHAHQFGLVHRDVKPSNILLAAPDDGQCLDGLSASLRHTKVKLADFGLARMRGWQTQITMAASVLGTPDYMSPEQARGDAELDHRSDLYSAGVVLYEMLSGHAPFHSDTPTVTLHRILHEEPAHPRVFADNVDPHLASLALRLMAKRPDDRFASAEEALAALETARPIVQVARRRRRRRAFFGVVAGVALVVGIGWLAGPKPTGPAPISAVRIDPDMSSMVHVRRGASTEFEGFYAAPEGATCSSVQMLDDGQDQLVFVTHTMQTNTEAPSVVALDAQGELVWKETLGTPPSIEWPDCVYRRNWQATEALLADVDGEPGDELIVIAMHMDEYPSAIMQLDPYTGARKHAYWNFGHLSQMTIAPDYFAPGHPALFALLSNNKLDGFEAPEPSDPSPLTEHDIVAGVVILDPRNMDGLGPPYTERDLGIPPLMPHAYAFLDFPAIPGGAEGPRIAKVLPVLTDQGLGIENAQLQIDIHLRTTPEQIVGTLFVDGNLEWGAYRAPHYQEGIPSEDEVRRAWHPIIQRGQWVDQLPADGPVPRLTFPTTLPNLEDVWVDPRDERVVMARRVGADSPELFHRFAGTVADAQLVEPEPGGAQIVVVGMADATPRGCLMSFRSDASGLWNRGLTRDAPWPDCKPSSLWSCEAPLVVGDLDGRAGDELVVMAHDRFEYPSRLSIIDVDTGMPTATFFHLGQLGMAKIVPDFFSPGHPAIVAIGVNNKLDGFVEDPPAGVVDPPPLTEHDHVPVIMILDPLRLDGLGPPYTRRLPFEPAYVHAYAFVDVSTETVEREIDGPHASLRGHLTDLNVEAYSQTREGAPWITFRVQWIDGSQRTAGELAIYTVNRDLEIQFAIANVNEIREGRGDDHWRARYRRIMFDGEMLQP